MSKHELGSPQLISAVFRACSAGGLWEEGLEVGVVARLEDILYGYIAIWL